MLKSKLAFLGGPKTVIKPAPHFPWPVITPAVEKAVKNLDELLGKSDYVILATDHDEFKNMDLSKLKKFRILAVIDGRNCLDKEKIKSMGILYHGVGRG